MMGNSEFQRRKDYENLCKELDEEQTSLEDTDWSTKQKRLANKLTKISDLKERVAAAFETKDEIVLSVGFKTLLKKLYAYTKYNKWSTTEDNPLQPASKGVLVEQESINMINRVYGYTLSKNKQKISNEYLLGIPDCRNESSGGIVEVKSSWDAVKFFDLIDKDLDKNYWWQTQGYLAITGATHGEVIYTLVTTPNTLIDEQVDRLKRNMQPQTSEDWSDFYSRSTELIKNLSFDDIPEQERVIKFEVKRNHDAIAKVYEKVELCRKYLSTIEEQHLNPTLWQRDTSPILA